jgi:Bacterial membrane protein YfhO
MNKLFTPLRFGILLALLICAMFPQVVLGLETFVARDFGFFAYPLAHFQRECFWRGELPFWNPYNQCGVPFLAQWNTMPLYPPSLVYLMLPLQWSLSFFCLLHLWFAGLGMFFLARRWTGNNFAAAFAGTVFSFNGFTLGLLIWPSHIATFSWMPWVVLAAELAWCDGGRKIFLAGILGALQMLAGGPETISLTWLIVAALWLQSFIKKDFSRATMFWRFPLVIALVIALSAAQLLPFLDLVAHAQRANGYTDLRWSMPSFGLANFLVPMAFGTTHTEGIFFQNGQYWTSSYYLGLGTLWLALLAFLCIRQRLVWLLAAITAAGLLCALGENTPFYPLLRKIIPQLSFITYPIKFVMIVVFAAPLLASFALAGFQKIQRRIFPVGAILLIAVIGVSYLAQLAVKPDADTHAALLNGISRAAFLIVTGAILFALTRTFKCPLLRCAPLILILVAWLDVLTHEPTQNPTVPPSVFELNLARTKLAMQPQPALGESRAMVAPAAMLGFINFALRDPKNNFLAKRLGYCADCNTLDDVPKTDGFFSLTPCESDGLISLLYGATNADFPRLNDFMGVSQITAPDEFFHWQSRRTYSPLVTAGQKPIFLDDAKTLQALAQNDFDGGKIVFLPPESKPFVTVSNQTVAKILNSKFATQSVTADVEATEPSLVVVVQTYYHNWHVYVDGQPTPLLRANYAFQAFQVPAGEHKIHLAYEDRAFEIGAAISGIAWLGSFSALLLLRRRSVNP